MATKYDNIPGLTIEEKILFNILREFELLNSGGSGSYVAINGSTPMTGSLDLANFNILNVSALTSFGATFVTPSISGNLLVDTGTTDGSSASTGKIGEELFSTVSTYTNYTTTNAYQRITSITLSAGDWELSAMGTFSANLATLTAASNAIFALSTTDASATGTTEGKTIVYVHQAGVSAQTAKQTVTIAPIRIIVSSPTTYYFNSLSVFTAGNPQYVGSIKARRLR